MKDCFDNNRPFGLVSGKEDSNDGVGTLLYVTAFDELHEDGSSLVSLKAGYRFSMQDIHVDPNTFGLYTGNFRALFKQVYSF
jgi:Lon protease-like protein